MGPQNKFRILYKHFILISLSPLSLIHIMILLSTDLCRNVQAVVKNRERITSLMLYSTSDCGGGVPLLTVGTNQGSVFLQKYNDRMSNIIKPRYFHYDFLL